MGNGSLSKKKKPLSPSCENNTSSCAPPISVEPASAPESVLAGTDPVNTRENLPLYWGKPAAVASGEIQSRLCVTQALVDHKLTITSDPDLSNASSRVGLRSGLSHCTSNPPLTDTSSGICSLYAMDLEGGTDDLPKIGSARALSSGAARLRMLLSQLERGEMPSPVDLKVCLSYAASVLEDVSKTEPDMRSNEGDELPDVTGEVVSDQVRDWLASTFTRQSSSSARRKNGQSITLRGVVQAVRMHIKLNTAHKQASGPQYPQAVRDSQNVDGWSFDVFYLNTLTDFQPLRYVGFEVFRRYDLMSKFKISVNVLDGFLQQIESGYNLYSNPYHNAIHASDVTQSMHSLLWETGLKDWLSDLEVFGALLAAIIHDFEHTGTTNTFHIQCRSETALLYNDKSVLENHHLSAAFRIMRKDESNILANLPNEEFREIRALVIEMVLATDMSSHFQQLNSVKSMISGASGPDNLDKTKSLSLCLHCCDIGHPTKDWNLHELLSDRVVEEFFCQGDREKELGLPYSPLCDRSTTLVPESQVGFIDFIVKPLFETLKDMLDVVLPLPTDSLEISDISEDAKEDADADNMEKQKKHNLWMEALTNNCLSNRDRWKDQFRPKDVSPMSEEGPSEHSVSDSVNNGTPSPVNAETSESKSLDAKHVQAGSSQRPVARQDSDVVKKRAAAGHRSSATREGVGRPRLTGNPKSPTKQRPGRQASNPGIPSKQLSSPGGDR